MLRSRNGFFSPSESVLILKTITSFPLRWYRKNKANHARLGSEIWSATKSTATTFQKIHPLDPKFWESGGIGWFPTEEFCGPCVWWGTWATYCKVLSQISRKVSKYQYSLPGPQNIGSVRSVPDAEGHAGDGDAHDGDEGIDTSRDASVSGHCAEFCCWGGFWFCDWLWQWCMI